jgi:hypothetical protein
MNMAKREKVGYVVVSGEGQALMLDRYDDSPAVLVSGGEATVFRTRRAARNAIVRSGDYAARNQFEWRTERWQIYRLTKTRSKP